MNRVITISSIAAVFMGLTACGSGAGGSPTNTATTLPVSGSFALVSASGTESGVPTKIVAVPGGTAVVALFPDGRAFYSPDGFNLAGGGSTVAANGSSLQIIDIVALAGGVDALLSNGSVYFSPDGMNLAGGGSTVHAYSGTTPISSLTAVANGVDAVLSTGAYFSPDGRNLDGGGASVLIYAGHIGILQIVPVGSANAVVTLLANGSAYLSPDNRDIGGGGSTVPAAASAHASVKSLLKVGGGILAEFSNGTVYLSPDGNNLAGGGATVAVSMWDASLPDGPFAPRDSAPGAEFAGHLWLSGGYSNPTKTNSCFATCSNFDLWSSANLTGTSWNPTPNFATTSSPNPRDDSAGTNSGVPDVPAPTDFYEAYSPIVNWNGKLFAIGSTVWNSANGTQWAKETLADGVTPVAGPLPFRATENSRVLTLGASLFFVQPDTGAVYSTTDPNAAVWANLGLIAGFAPRCGAVVFVLQAKIWIEGGGACDYSRIYNDVWSSTDGVNWSQDSKPTEWPARMWSCIAAGSTGIVWLAGGYAPTDWNNTGGAITVRAGANHSDVWYSKDGTTWKQFKEDYGSALPDGSALEPRHAATCFSVAGSSADMQSLVVIAGTGGTDFDDADARVLNSIRTLPLPPIAELP